MPGTVPAGETNLGQLLPHAPAPPRLTKTADVADVLTVRLMADKQTLLASGPASATGDGEITGQARGFEESMVRLPLSRPAGCSQR